MRSLLAGLLVTAAACGARQEHPYRFRSPLLGSVQAPELPPVRFERTQDAGDGGQGTGNRRLEPRLATAPPRRPVRHERAPVDMPRLRRSIPAEALGANRGDELAALARSMVGRRDEGSTHLQVALAALVELGATPDPELAGVEDGPALMALAERRGALTPLAPGAPLPALRLGDLLVFDRVVASDPASLVGLVVSVDERGVVEFVYLSRGVVRRGFAFPPSPSTRRDPTSGRVMNTFIRHNEGADPRGTRHLAGELIAAAISLDRLLR